MSKLQPGSKLGKWTLVDRLGEGGNGVVWKTHDDEGNIGALKVLKSYLLENTKDNTENERRARRANRFLDEIQFLRSTDLTGIVPLLDSFLPDNHSKDARPWLVMPLGESLPKYMLRIGRDLSDIVRIFHILAETLSELHEQGSAHRDIKPDNIIVIEDSPYLSDFGLVQYEGKNPNTSDSEILGPLFFVAHEMMPDENSDDPRPADIYSFAKTFWVTATGQRFPLPGEQRVGFQAMTLSAYVSDRRAYLLDRLIDECTRHSPVERPSASQVARELAGWCVRSKSKDEPLKEVQSIALSISSLTANIDNEHLKRKQMIKWGMQLMEAAESKLPPLVEALNKFEFKDSNGDPMPARIIGGENNRLWDQWTYPNTLVKDSKESVWRGSKGTLAHFVKSKGGVMLISGIQIDVNANPHVTFCAAHVCVSNNGGKESSEVVWREDAIEQIGKVAADSAMNSLIDKLFESSPQATSTFAETIRRSLGH